MNLFFIYIFMLILSGCGRHYTTHRSPLRKPSSPTIVVSDGTSPHHYARTSNHYKRDPIFTTFDYQFFVEHQLPPLGIQIGSDLVNTQKLNAIIQEILDALLDGAHTLPHCTLIRDANFNYTTLCGALMVKLDEYPLIVKLFRETAESFVLPFSKGLEPVASFFMSGGSNRHISGLTRIPNRSYLLSKINEDTYWKDKAHIPRKWYWAPDPIEWLSIDGYFLDATAQEHAQIPATYAVVADYIDVGDSIHIEEDIKKDMIMELCTLCSLHLDPNIKNFICVYDQKTQEPRVFIVDTENHSCMTGLTEPMVYTNHLEWYLVLGSKFLKDLFFNVKQEHA